jgi:ubiquitin-protein ligase
MANTLKQRLLRDIAELQSKPYPNIELHVQDDDFTQACLVLTVDGYGPMHLTVTFPSNFPLAPPTIKMDSQVVHPNIFNTYICASILNTTEGYTPAYTLKGIAIQLLSFFGSDKIEQVGGGVSVDLKTYRDIQSTRSRRTHTCTKCSFGLLTVTNGMGNSTSRRKSQQTMAVHSRPGSQSPPSPPSSMSDEDLAGNWPIAQQSSSPKQPVILGRNTRRRKAKENALARAQAAEIPSIIPPEADTVEKKPRRMQDMGLPNEVLLLVAENLETEDLMAFAEAWTRVGHVMTRYDVIRTRELQCFCLKKNYLAVKLGVGIAVVYQGRIGSFESEFDLLSQEGYSTHNIRRSVHGVPFKFWLPLPISRGHWNKVRDDVHISLSSLSSEASLGAGPPVEVIYHFMNDIVVKLNTQTSQATTQSPYYPYEEMAKSTLQHASERAMESYFHMFHLLLCMATSQPAIVKSANGLLRGFGQGKNSKTECPNLGTLLVAALVSDVGMSECMIKSIVKETVTRNVVWMLDSKGANMPELVYLEPSAISNYRLQKTFDASKISYRLLMFLNLFRKTAIGSPRKPLIQLRDEAFERHGAPPRGSAKGLADSIKRIHKVSNFPEFLGAMGISSPSAAWFTNFLRECMEASVKKGYSKMPFSQGHALALRQRKDPGVEVAEGVYAIDNVDLSRVSFFPGRSGAQRHRGSGRRR